VSKFSYKKLLCLLLTLGVLGLPSCTDSGTDESTGAPPISADSNLDSSKDAAQWVEGLDTLNDKYKGKIFKVVTVSSGLFEDDSETPIAKQIMERNALIEQKFGIGFNVVEKAASDLKNELRTAASEGKGYADLVCAPMDVLADLAVEGLLENLYSLPYVDYGAGYTDKAALESQSVKNTMYMMSGLSTMDIGATVGLFYNKKMLDGIGVDPFAMAREGNWTWSELQNIAKTISGEGVYGIDTLLDDTETLVSIYSSCGGKLIDRGNGGEAIPAFNDAIASYAVSIQNGLFNDGTMGGNYSADEAVNAFNTGKLCFLTARLDNVGLFDKAESEWGLVPLPKHTASQGYVSPVCGNTLAFAVPKGNEDSAFSGFILNALLAASTDSLDKALKQTYVNYHFWSNNAALMLELIGDTKQVDLGVAYSSVTEVYEAGLELLTATEITTLPEEKAALFNEFAKKFFK